MTETEAVPVHDKGWLQFTGTMRSRVKVQGRYISEVGRSLDLIRADESYRAWWGGEPRLVRVFLAFNDHHEEWGPATTVRKRKDDVELRLVVRADLMTSLSGDELIRAAQDDLRTGLVLVAKRLKMPDPPPLPSKVLRNRKSVPFAAHGTPRSGARGGTRGVRRRSAYDADASMEASPLSQIVEIHVPLTPPPDPPSGEYPYPWIEEVDEFLAEQGDHGDIHTYDDGEEYEDYYVFSLRGGTEDEMLRLANQVADLPGVPEGVVAFVAEDESETFGRGRRVQLPYRSQPDS